MTVTVELSVPIEAFPLNGIFRASPSARIAFEPIVHRSGPEVWSFRVYGIDPATLEEALGADEHVRRSRTAGTDDERALIEVVWEADSEPTGNRSANTTEGRIGNGGDSGTERMLLRALDEYDVTVLALVGTDRNWEFTLRFPDRETTQAFQTAALNASHSLSVTRVVDSEAGGNRSGIGTDLLTPAQREVFTLALEGGYFEIPRRITQVEIAEEVGISDQAVSERLRRAQKKLGRAAMSPEPA